MMTNLLKTKLQIPPQAHHTLQRPRLIDALDIGIPRYKLTLLSAPAGYGKTTLLVQWARSSHLPIVWLSLGEEDNNFERFLQYLLAGWEQIQPDVRKGPLELLTSAILPKHETALAAFINAASDLTSHLTFILDDYHLIEDHSIHQALAFLLDHLPPLVHIVLASRTEPPLSLARYRARHEILELRADTLQFSLDETADFLNERMELDLTPHTVAELQNQLEGWISGLELVAITLCRHRGVRDTPAISGRHRFVAKYLSEDVLDRLPEKIRRFLLWTSILDRLCGSICDAVMNAGGGQAVLELMERENLFLVSLDDNQEWFRYHRLFADFLQNELARSYADEIPVLHRRAATWYLAHDLPEQALHHAIAGDDIGIVVQIFERYFLSRLLGREVTIVERWLQSLPDAWQAFHHPSLSIFQAAFLFSTGQINACMCYLDEIEQLALAAENSDTQRRRLGRVAAVRCFVACYHDNLASTEAFARSALQNLSEDDLDLRHAIYCTLGDLYRRHGRWEEARECYRRGLIQSWNMPHVGAFRVQTVDAYGALADLDLRRGCLRSAAVHWRRALAVIDARDVRGNVPLPLIGWVYIRLGEILYEWNELGEASDCLSQGLERVELGGDARGMIAGYLLAGRLKLTAGDLPAARDYLQRAHTLIENTTFPDLIGRFGRLHLEILMAQNRLTAAVDWAGAMLRSGELEGGIESEVARLALARAQIAKGDDIFLGQVLTLLEDILLAAQQEGRAGASIAALILQSLAYWRRNEYASALTCLEQALRIAEPEGYVRLFADLGLPMAQLLQEARSRGIMPDYLERLLAACERGFGYFALTRGKNPEPLSVREQGVLRLIAAGLTNREIAESLVISAETVKKHTSSIYRKLGVNNRAGAVSQARDLELLG